MDNIQNVAKQGNSTSCATFDLQSYGKHVTSGSNLNQIYAGHATSFLPETGQDEVPHIGEIEHLEKTSKHTRVELVPSKSAIGSFGREISSAIRVMYDLQSHNCSLKSDEALKHRLFERSLSSPSDSRNYEMMDPIYFEYLQKTFKEPIETFGNEPTEGIQLPSFEEIGMHNQGDHDIGGTHEKYEEQTGIAGIPRTQVRRSSSNLQTFKLKSFPESVDSRPEQKVNPLHKAQLPSRKRKLNKLTEEEYQFVRNFKLNRIRLGIPQTAVVQAMNTMMGKIISDSSISKFETFTLSPKTMRNYISVLRRWLQERDPSYNTGNLPSSSTCSYGFPESNIKELRVYNLSQPKAKELLEKVYGEDPMPTPNKIRMLPLTLNERTITFTEWMRKRRKKEENLDVKYTRPPNVL